MNIVIARSLAGRCCYRRLLFTRIKRRHAMRRRALLRVLRRRPNSSTGLVQDVASTLTWELKVRTRDLMSLPDIHIFLTPGGLASSGPPPRCYAGWEPGNP